MRCRGGLQLSNRSVASRQTYGHTDTHTCMIVINSGTAELKRCIPLIKPIKYSSVVEHINLNSNYIILIKELKKGIRVYIYMN